MLFVSYPIIKVNANKLYTGAILLEGIGPWLCVSNVANSIPDYRDITLLGPHGMVHVCCPNEQKLAVLSGLDFRVKPKASPG